MKFSSVSLSFCILSFAYLFPFLYQKKLHLDFLFFVLFCIPCIQFFANLSANSLQILVRSYLTTELRWQVFSLWWTRSHRFVVFGPTEPFRCNRSTQLGATDFTTGKTTCHLFLHSFCSRSTQWFLSSTSITFDLLLCFVTQGPNPFVTNIQKSPSWKLMSKGEREITSKLNHFYRGRENTQRERILHKEKEVSHRRPQMLGVQEERSHMSLRGEIHVYIWLFQLCFFVLIFCTLSSPNIPYKIQGEQDI